VLILELGKTVLFSAVINKIKEGYPDALVAFFYYRCNDPAQRTFDSVAHALVTQILLQNSTCLDYLYEKMVASGESHLSSPVRFLGDA